MPSRFAGSVLIALAVLAGARASVAAESRVAILCYHELTDDPSAPAYFVSPAKLKADLGRLQAAGWRFLPLSEVVARARAGSDLPPKVALLTFDDGYRSFLDKALPILREARVPATLAVITSFVDHPPSDLPPLLTWEEIRGLEKTGLVEIASHTDALHRYESDNPYRDSAPSTSTRRYLSEEARYETRDEYRTRVREDLLRSQRRLTEELGHPVAVLAWPYGEYTEEARRLAGEAGFPTTLALGGGAAGPLALRSGTLPRVMVFRDTPVGAADSLWLEAPAGPVFAAQIDLDDLYDPDPARLGARLDRVIERARAVGATHVFLQTCADPVGDGFLRETWFMNHQMPVRADLWSMVAHRLTQAGLAVWARAPSLNLSWQWQRHPEWRVPFRVRRDGGGGAPWYYRLAPDLPEVRQAAVDFFTDLAVYLPIRGVVFDDDAYLRADEALATTGSRAPSAKRDTIEAYLGRIREAVRAWRPDCRFARVLYPSTLDAPGTAPQLAQDFSRSLAEEDLVIVSATGSGTGGSAPEARIERLARRAQARRSALPSADRARVLIRLEARDGGSSRRLSAQELVARARAARRGGAVDLGLSALSAEGDAPPAGLLRPVPSRSRADTLSAGR